MASDGTTIWVSSVLDRQILACRKTCRTIATLPRGLHPFAIAWDTRRKRLWVAADCPSGVPQIKACDRGALIGLSSGGRVVTRIAPPSGSFHPGDVSASAGQVYVSDGQNGAIYRLAKSGYSISAVIKSGEGKSAQGTALDAEGGRLMVADYSLGVGALDLSSLARTILPRQDGKPLRGIDGLLRCGTTYYGIYNGSSPGQLLAIEPTATSLTLTEVADLSDPTQLALDGTRLLIVADSGWATIEKADFKRATGATILAVPLPDDCKPQ